MACSLSNYLITIFQVLLTIKKPVIIGPICPSLILHGTVVVGQVLHSNAELNNLPQYNTLTAYKHWSVQAQVQPKTDCFKPEVCVLTIHDCINQYEVTVNFTLNEQKQYI
jgi:hypothetical protein